MKHPFPCKRKYSNHQTGKKSGGTEYLSATVHIFVYFSTKKKGEEDEKFRRTFEDVRQDLLNNAILDTEEKAFAEKHCIVTKGTDGSAKEVRLNEAVYRLPY